MLWITRTGPLLLAAVALLAATPALAEPVLVAAAAARVRAQPTVTAPEVTRLPLGAAVEASERFGQGAEAWRRVAAPGGGGGWVAERFLRPFDPARRDDAYLALARQRLVVADAPFGDQVELVQFLDRAKTEAQGREARAELAFGALLALSRSTANLTNPEAELPVNQAWIKANETRLVYSEPAGQWMLRASLLWDLEKASRDTPLGERMAWEACKTDLPGECEGYLPCYLTFLLEQEGEYLARYPRGAHAAEALATVEAEFAGALADGGSGNMEFGDWSEDMPRVLASWRKILPKVPGSAKALTQLGALDRLAANPPKR